MNTITTVLAILVAVEHLNTKFFRYVSFQSVFVSEKVWSF